tara:strand:- start:627 stop:1490 length:864 start_codon:yes stop_codon:yes gene_type:complete
MNHPAELALHQYMEDAVAGKTTMSAETIEQVASDVKDAMKRQFNSMGRKGDFRLRMSNIGRPSCQLWYEKNKPEVATPLPTTFIMNMMLGDIVEAVFKGLLKETGVKYEDSETVTLELSDTSINGTYDIVIRDAVDDIKSASNWSYTNKFESYETLASSDGFGYIAQLAGYAKASGKQAGGWWVVNKANGDFKYVPAKWMDVEKEIEKVEETVAKLKENKFERCFKPEKETFRREETGNLVLNKNCTFCSFKYDCWPEIIERPAVKSQAKQPKIVQYIKLSEEYDAA